MEVYWENLAAKAYENRVLSSAWSKGYKVSLLGI